MQHEDEYVKPQPIPESAPPPPWYENRDQPVQAWAAPNPPVNQDQLPVGQVVQVAVPVHSQGKKRRTFCIAVIALVGSVLALLAVAVATSMVLDRLKEDDQEKTVVVKNYYKVPNRRAMDLIREGLIELEEDDDEDGGGEGFLQDYEELFEYDEDWEDLFGVLPISDEEDKFYKQREEERKASVGEDDDLKPKKKKDGAYKPKARRLLAQRNRRCPEYHVLLRHVSFAAMVEAFLRETVRAWPALDSVDGQRLLFDAMLPLASGTKVVPRSGFGPRLIYVVGGGVDGETLGRVEMYDPQDAS